MLIWIPPAERRRFKGLDMAHKTKAAMQGRQSYNVLLKRIQGTKHSAGSQNQAFGSMPNLRSFSRQASLTHELNCPAPAALLICSNNSSSKRMFLAVLLERSKSRLGFFSCIGIYRSCRVKVDGIYHLLLKQVLKTAKPGSARTLTRPLTTNR